VKGGSIIPILAHKRELSLLNAIKNNIRLDIYPDSHNFADGLLYLDDGESLDHLKGDRTLVSYVYLNSILTATKLNPTDQHYAGAAKKKIESVSIFGLDRAPVAVRNLVSDINLDDT
jgi:alpha-glucosidase (family GH31 glycosyl hydrolase)